MRLIYRIENAIFPIIYACVYSYHLIYIGRTDHFCFFNNNTSSISAYIIQFPFSHFKILIIWRQPTHDYIYIGPQYEKTIIISYNYYIYYPLSWQINYTLAHFTLLSSIWSKCYTSSATFSQIVHHLMTANYTKYSLYNVITLDYLLR